MPTLSEFQLTLHLRYEETTGTTYTVFSFSTVRQFRAFQYEIQVEDTLDTTRKVIELTIRGVRAPADLMPSTGSAVKQISFPELQGEYRVDISGAKQFGTFSFSVNSTAIQLLDTPDTNFIHITVQDEIETILA